MFPSFLFTTSQVVIEDDDDREFMKNLFLEYQRLMYSEIYQITRDTWSTEDVLQSTLVNLIDKIPLLRSLDRNRLVNYIITSSKNTAINYLKKEKRIPFSLLTTVWILQLTYMMILSKLG